MTFVCLGCGTKYRDLGDLFRCVKYISPKRIPISPRDTFVLVTHLSWKFY